MNVPDNDTVSGLCKNLPSLSRDKNLLKCQIMSVDNMNLLMNALKVPNSDGLKRYLTVVVFLLRQELKARFCPSVCPSVGLSQGFLRSLERSL